MTLVASLISMPADRVLRPNSAMLRHVDQRISFVAVCHGYHYCANFCTIGLGSAGPTVSVRTVIIYWIIAILRVLTRNFGARNILNQLGEAHDVCNYTRPSERVASTCAR